MLNKSLVISSWLFVIGILFSSCSTTHTLTNNFSATAAKKVNYVAPFCNITLFNDSTHHYDLDSATFIGAKNIVNVVTLNKSHYHLKEKIDIPNIQLRQDFYTDALDLATDIGSDNKLRNKTISLNIANVLNSQDENYLGLIIYDRKLPSKKQLKEKTEGIIINAVVATVVGVATGGMFIPMVHPDSGQPIEQGGFYLLIFDKTNQRACYYKKVAFAKNDYADSKILKDKMDTLFEIFLVSPQFNE